MHQGNTRNHQADRNPLTDSDRKVFDLKVLSRFPSSLAPTSNFLDGCFRENISAVDTVSLWNNRLR